MMVSTSTSLTLGRAILTCSVKILSHFMKPITCALNDKLNWTLNYDVAQCIQFL